MIRQLAAAELGRLDPLGREFYGTSRFLETFSIERFFEIWEALLANGAGVIFGEDCAGELVGVMGGIIHRDIYGEELIAEEMFWFVREASRGAGIRLYAAFEKWARKKGAASIQMVHLLDVMPEKVARFYLRAGYDPIETRYAKRLVAR